MSQREKMKDKMQNYTCETVVIPTLVLRRAKDMANGMGLPVKHGQGEDFYYLSVLDVVPQFPGDDFIPARWSLAMVEDGSWTVADAGRWDCLEVHVQPSIATYGTLAEALVAVQEARAAALTASI
jgi:hypothetical protein